jgi:hypothetical protein
MLELLAPGGGMPELLPNRKVTSTDEIGFTRNLSGKFLPPVCHPIKPNVAYTISYLRWYTRTTGYLLREICFQGEASYWRN